MSQQNQFQVEFYDKTSNRYAINVSDKPQNWDPTKQKASVFGLRTFSYVKFDIAKSSMQKAARRGYADETVYWALEMFRTTQSGITNMWNRLMIIAVEDIGTANPEAISMVYWLHETGKNNPYHVAQAAYLVSVAKKSRLTDLAYHYYSKIQSDKTSKEMFDYILTVVQEEYNFDRLFTAVSAVVQLNIRHIDERKKAQQEKKIRQAADPRKKIKARSTVNYLGKLVNDIAKLNNGDSQNYVEQTIKLKKNLTQGYSLSVILLVIVLNTKTDVYTVCDLTIDDRVKWLTGMIYSDNVKFDPLDYIFDKHTYIGRSQFKRGIKHFYDEASIITNRDDKWISLEEQLLSSIVSQIV